MSKLRRITLTRLILFRLLAAYLLLGVAIFGLQAVFEYRAQRTLIVSEMDRLAKAFGPLLASSAWDFQASAVEDIVRGIGTDPDVVEVQMKVGAGFPASQWTEPGGEPATALSVDYPLVYVDPSGARQALGTLFVASSYGRLWSNVLEALVSAILPTALSAAMVMLAVWWLVQRSVVLPLQHLASALQRFDPYEASHQALPRADGREFNVLRSTFLRVFRQAARSRAELQRSHDELEARVDERTHQLQLANQAKSQFLANMSHEIRTPMNAVLGMLALLKRSELHPRQADYAAKGEGAARALLGLINDVLDFSKIEAGKMGLDPQPVRLEQLFRELSVVLASNLGARPLELLLDLDPQLPEGLLVDPLRLQQVLINLGGNAIKFTEYGEVVLAAQMLGREQTAQGELVHVGFEIRDTGIGIAPENQARIFSAFTQADAGIARRFGGTGLGVAICQRIVALMGGELQLDSTLGLGSRFHFSLKLPGAQLPPLARPARPAVRRVLVVDDNPAALDVLCRMTEAAGWETSRATDAAEGLVRHHDALAEGRPFEAAFIDWQMEGVDGWELCRALRQQPPHAPVIVMVTAHGREVLAQRSIADQALLDGYLVKPVTASMLVDALHHALAPAASVEPTAAPAHRLRGLSLLVVDDNTLNQQVALDLLESEGARVMAAGNGREALDVLALPSLRFDLVLMDMQMPVMDGLQATRLMREQPALRQLPVIALTANAMASDREACLAAGMNAHVGKPFDLEELVREILAQLGRSEPAPVPAPRAAAVQAPQRAADAAIAAGVLLAEALDRMGGQAAIYARTLEAFVAELDPQARQLPELLSQGQLDQARLLAHSLKGQAATLGAADLAELAAEAEYAFAPGSGQGPASQAELANALATAMQAAAPALRGLVAALTPQASAARPAADASGADAALRALAQALRESDMRATDLMLEVRQRFAPLLGDRLEPLDQAVRRLDFARATALLEPLLPETLE